MKEKTSSQKPYRFPRNTSKPPIPTETRMGKVPDIARNKEGKFQSSGSALSKSIGLRLETNSESGKNYYDRIGEICEKENITPAELSRFIIQEWIDYYDEAENSEAENSEAESDDLKLELSEDKPAHSKAETGKAKSGETES